jgi:predicted dehydrogenase
MTNTFGIVGIGGYGGEICRDLLEEWNLLPMKLVAAHDPMAAQFPETVEALESKGVAFYPTLESMLAAPMRAVWLPVPIDFHRVYTEKALAAGKVVLCEKPAAGCIQDVDAMIWARDAAGTAKEPAAVAIGYQHLYAPSTHAMKQRILAGHLGALSDAALYATWHRTSRYYARAWAGKMQRNGVWLLDSPANNAFAHWVHLLLFLYGPSAMTSAVPVSVEAELYRANPIENYDTCAFRIKLDTGQTLLMYLSHATNVLREPLVRIEGTKASMTVDAREGTYTVVGGEHPVELPLSPIEHSATVEGLAAFIEDRTKPHASLEMSRMHALVISGASQCTPVYTVAPPDMEIYQVESGSVHHIPGITALFEAAIVEKKLPHETGEARWTRRAGQIDLRHYTQFTGAPAEH